MKSIFKLILSIVTFLGVTYVLAIIFIVSILRSSSEKMSSNFNNVPYKIEKTVHDSYLPKSKMSIILEMFENQFDDKEKYKL